MLVTHFERVNVFVEVLFVCQLVVCAFSFVEQLLVKYGRTRGMFSCTETGDVESHIEYMENKFHILAKADQLTI